MHVAQNLVKTVSVILPFPISLSDAEGYIIGATDSERLGQLHEPSKEVLLKKDFVSYEEEKVAKLDNVLPGVAVPLNFGFEIIGVLGIIGPPEEVEPHAQLIKKYVEVMWQETFHKQIEDLDVKTLETFMQYILLNESISKIRVEQYAQILKLNYDANYFCIVIDIGDSLINRYENDRESFAINNLKEKILQCADDVFATNENDVCAFLNLEKVIVLKSVPTDKEFFRIMEQIYSKSKRLINKFKSYGIADVYIASGNLYRSLYNVNQSFHEAESLMQYGRDSQTTLKIYNYYSWDILLKLLPEQINNDIIVKINYRLKPLLENEGFSELKRDFLMYCDNNMNISEAAKKLFIHRNTLIYRLKKIEELTSLSTRNFQHCMILYLALEQKPVLP